MDDLQWKELSPLGVEVFADLSQPLSLGWDSQLRRLLNKYGLLLARGQALSMARQQELCAILGPILLREGESGYMTNEGGGPSASELTWHSDAAYTKHPFDALSLHALDVVDNASSTLFVSAQRAYDELPASLRGILVRHEQEMIAPHYSRLAERTCDRRNPEAQKQGVMPSIYQNPHNGHNCIWVSELQTTRLLGMEWEESRGVLHEIFDRLYAPENIFAHYWCKGDIIIWDNIALQHMRGSLDGVGKRLLQRVIVGSHGAAPHVQNRSDN